MAYRTPVQVKAEFRAYPRRALILTTLVHEGRAIQAHLTCPERLIGESGGVYEYGRFSDPAGDWLVVHAFTAQGNSDASLVASKAFQEFGAFDVQMFVGVAGSLKEDIPIGSVIVGDYVYNGHSAKVEDRETLSRPHGLPAARALLAAAQGLIYSDEWRDLIRPPTGMDLPNSADYPCEFPPSAFIKGIVSGEEVVAGDQSSRYAWLRSAFNDAGAVEMEGWGVMNAARHENTPAIIVRGVSDMCGGKHHEKDKLHQPIAAAHAAAFAFGILSFRSKVPVGDGRLLDGETDAPVAVEGAIAQLPDERRVEFVFNFEGTIEEWSEEKIQTVIGHIKEVMNDEKLTLIRVDVGSVRLIVSVRESDLAHIDLTKLREAAANSGVTLLGATSSELMREAETAKSALAVASADLVAWERNLPNGRWMERPEQEGIESRFKLNRSSTVLLGDPGSGKSALLSKIASDLLDSGAPVFALKADFLSTDVRTESDLQHELQLPALPSELILRLASLQPVYVLIDQLDALASQLDLRSGRLNVLLNLVRRIGNQPNVHVLLSARTFEFNHDARLRAIEAEGVNLALPPWHEVKERLAEVGVNPDTWPEKARDVVRIPQALKTFIALAGSGRAEPFITYQAMLEQLWNDRIASAHDSDRLIAFASDLAADMAEEETLWLAASRFDDRLSSLKRLESLGFLVRSENNLSISFSHQTVFDYVLARTFVRNAGLLSTYVLERQDSLFVRAKIWSAFSYLREAEVKSYEREFSAIWMTHDLRRHLRLLLIEFLGQVREPLEFEKTFMADVMSSPDNRILGLKAIGGSPGWFAHFASTAIRDAMSGTIPEVGQACRILALNWKTDGQRVVSLIKERWLPRPERDNYSWMALDDCIFWTEEVEEVAATVLKRTPISIWHVGHTATTLAVEQPDAALRLVRAKLDFLLAEVMGQPDPPEYPMDGTDQQKVAWSVRHDPIKEFKHLLDTAEWSDLPALAEAAPGAFLHHLWPWYVAVFAQVIANRNVEGVKHLYPGQYLLEIEPASASASRASRERPVMSAVQIAIEELAAGSREDFLNWAEANSGLDVLAVQQLIAYGFEFAADRLGSKALEWLLLDDRRFQLGTHNGLRRTTINLVRASAPYWSTEEMDRFENSVIDYRPDAPSYLKEPEQRRGFADVVRATKKDLLQAAGVERLAPKNRELVATEQRALGDRFDRSVTGFGASFIGSPMEASAMSKAKDRDILNILREVPDNTNWDHPTHWIRGGNIQLSRAFAEFARSDPERAVRLMEQFEPLQQERAAGYALDAIGEIGSKDELVLDAFVDLHRRGFQAEEFRESAAHAIGKVASRKVDISEEVIGVLIDWLRCTPIDGTVAQDDIELTPSSEDEGDGGESILWGFGSTSILPSGNFSVLSALTSILLGEKEAARDRLFAILNDHLSCEQNPNVWKALLYRLSGAGGSTPGVVSNFFRKLIDRHPEILGTTQAVVFLAHAQRWDEQMVFDVIREWRRSERRFLQRAYGELVGLVATVASKENWILARDDIIASGTDEMKIGLANAAVNMWPDDELRATAGDTLVALLQNANKRLVAVVMDVFRVVDELLPDTSTANLLRALAHPKTDLSAAPSTFVVERLQLLLPHEAELIASVAKKLVAAWRDELGDLRTGTVTAAPQLTDLALTLHRLGGSSRQSGVALFEEIIEIDAYGARQTLAEIDGRFGAHQGAARRRLTRRRSARGPRQ